MQILSYVAEKERENIKKRQREGIELAKAENRQLGRPRAKRPENFVEVYGDWKSGKFTARKAMEILGLKPTTFYKFVRGHEGKS